MGNAFKAKSVAPRVINKSRRGDVTVCLFGEVTGVTVYYPKGMSVDNLDIRRAVPGVHAQGCGQIEGHAIVPESMTKWQGHLQKKEYNGATLVLILRFGTRSEDCTPRTEAWTMSAEEWAFKRTPGTGLQLLVPPTDYDKMTPLQRQQTIYFNRQHTDKWQGQE